MLSIIDLDEATKRYAAELNALILQSINEQGLIPCSTINTNKCLPNMSVEDVDKRHLIFINHVNLPDSSSDENVASVLDALLWNDMTGVYSIALEREWPFSLQKNNRQINFNEIFERLYANILFVLKPPSKNIRRTNKITSEGMISRLLGSNYQYETTEIGYGEGDKFKKIFDPNLTSGEE